MYRFFALMDSQTSSNPATPAVPETIPTSYTDFEIIFWYAAFIVMVILFVVFLKTHRSGKNEVSRIAAKIQKNIRKFEEMIESGEKKAVIKKSKIKELIARTQILIEKNTATFIELRSSTCLDDFDRLIGIGDKIVSECKKLNISDESKLTDQLKKIHMFLLKYKGQVELIIPLIRK